VVTHIGEDRRLRVLKNRELRRIFRPKRDEIPGERGKLYNEELNDLYSSPNIISSSSSYKALQPM
jgi:hypothetical protein